MKLNLEPSITVNHFSYVLIWGDELYQLTGADEISVRMSMQKHLRGASCVSQMFTHFCGEVSIPLPKCFLHYICSNEINIFLFQNIVSPFLKNETISVSINVFVYLETL